MHRLGSQGCHRGTGNWVSAWRSDEVVTNTIGRSMSLSHLGWRQGDQIRTAQSVRQTRPSLDAVTERLGRGDKYQGRAPEQVVDATNGRRACGITHRAQRRQQCIFEWCGYEWAKRRISQPANESRPGARPARMAAFRAIARKA